MTQRLKRTLPFLACMMLAVLFTATPSPAEETTGDVPAAASSSPAEGYAVPVAEPETHEAAADHVEAPAEENIGFPQLKPDSYVSQVFWLFISFIALYVLMSKVALPRITEVVDMRATQKHGNLSRAEQLQEEAGKVRSAYEASLSKAQEAAHSSTTEAEESAAEKLAAENAKFSEHARKRIVTAEQNILKAKNDALASLADISADIAADIVHKITDVQINKADAKKIALAEMQKG